MPWTDERVEALKKLWTDGLSASQIAGRLRGVSRNAVISKVHRLGLSGRATTSRNKSSAGARIPARAKVAKPPKAKARGFTLQRCYEDATEPYVPPAEALAIPINERKSLAQLEMGDCRWPIGDPQQPDFHFCGKSKIPGLPYCEVHARRAYASPTAQRVLIERTATIVETVQ